MNKPIGWMLTGMLAVGGLNPAVAETFTERVAEVWESTESDPTAVWTEGESHRFQVDALLGEARNQKGYQDLFEKDLSDAVMPGAPWTMNEGVLTPGTSKDIWTEGRFGDFILQLEFQCEDDTNSGVFLRCGDIDQWLHTSMEVQILQPEAGNGRHDCGGLFDCLAPTQRAVKPAGKWNAYTIMAWGSRLLVVLNGVTVLDADLDRWTEAGMNPDGTRNKFKTAYKDMPREGHIGLQYHGQPVKFRKLQIKKL